MTNSKKSIASLVVGLVAVVSIFSVKILKGKPSPLILEPAKIKGNPATKHYIVVFSDFSCPFCDIVRSTLDSVVSIYPDQIHLIYKHFPLRSHPNSPLAAEASECAADQNHFWEFHDLLFENVAIWDEGHASPKTFEPYARQLHLDLEKFSACLESGIKSEVVKKNREEGNKYFVSGTPTTLFDGRKIIRKANDLKFLTDVIKKELAKEKQTP